jgi:glycosyltransferase involved in cell wall biosynthesis
VPAAQFDGRVLNPRLKRSHAAPDEAAVVRPSLPGRVVAHPATNSSKRRPGISAVVITYNEAPNIAACIDSVAFCDEVLVVDAHSSDGTVDIAAGLGAKVIERDWPGYRAQKQFAAAAARHDWVLCLDADERVSPELREEICRLREQGFPRLAGASMRRRMWYFGAPLRFGTTSPDRLTRLFNRRQGGWRGRQVHEYAAADGPVARLQGRLNHFPYRSYQHQLDKLERYATLMAKEMAAEGRRGSLLRVLVNPLWCFLRGYVVRLGFLDGWRGLVFAYTEAAYVRQKYVKLYLQSRGDE